MRKIPLKRLVSRPVVNGLGLSGSENNTDDPRYIRITDIGSDGKLRDEVFASQPRKLIADAWVHSGDILVASVGATVGKSYMHRLEGNFCFAGYLSRVRPNRSKTDPRFLGYWMESHDWWDQVRQRIVGSTIENLSASKIASFSVPLVSLEEQRLIADYLDRETSEIDAFLHDQKLLIELLRERRLAQLAREVAGSDSGLAKHDVPWAPGLKTSFPTVNIRRVAEMRTGHTPNRDKLEYWLETHIPWFTLADVWQIRAGRKFLGETTEMISSLGLANSAADLLPAGTVVLSRTASVGFTGIMPRPMATSQDYWNWVCGPDILPEYLWFQFRAMRPEFDRIKSGSTHKTIYKADAAAITLVLPPLKDQQEIVQRLTAVDEELAAAEEDVLASIQLAQERRSALISAAVTGQLDVTAGHISAVEQLRDELEVHT